MVSAMAATGKVDSGAPVDRVEARDGGTRAAQLAMGCGVAEERALCTRGTAARWEKGAVRRQMFDRYQLSPHRL